VSSANGVSDEALDVLVEIPSGAFDTDTDADGEGGGGDPRLAHFEPALQVALAYADAMTTGDVDDALFARVRMTFTDDEIVELTEVIAWENASARFNRALRIESQGLWKRGTPDSHPRPG
jgi:alkylhydroperoxidase family enzyme